MVLSHVALFPLLSSVLLSLNVDCGMLNVDDVPKKASTGRQKEKARKVGLTEMCICPVF